MQIDLVLTSLTLTLLSQIAWTIIAVIAAVVLLWALREPYKLEVTHSQLEAEGFIASPRPRPAAIPGSPDSTGSTGSPGSTGSTGSSGSNGSSSRLRIALLTDLHAESLLTDLHAEFLRIKPDRLGQILATEEYDVLLFGGDLAGRHHKPKIARRWLDAIQAVAESRGIPCYAVIGNHDSAKSLEMLRQAGFRVLKNESAVLADREGREWLLLGLDILKAGQPDFGRALRSNTKAAAEIPPQRRVVLAHNPDTIFTLPGSSAGFFLAGHFHGGQIYMPFHLEFFLLRREKVGRMGFHKGQFRLNGLTCYISRGLGSVLFPLRLFSRPELPIIELAD